MRGGPRGLKEVGVLRLDVGVDLVMLLQEVASSMTFSLSSASL